MKKSFITAGVLSLVLTVGANEMKKVEMKMSSFLDYSSINMNVYDCSKVLGILLDNAIEASSISDEKEVELYISIDFYNRKQNIQISNTCIIHTVYKYIHTVYIIM